MKKMMILLMTAIILVVFSNLVTFAPPPRTFYSRQATAGQPGGSEWSDSDTWTEDSTHPLDPGYVGGTQNRVPGTNDIVYIWRTDHHVLATRSIGGFAEASILHLGDETNPLSTGEATLEIIGSSTADAQWIGILVGEGRLELFSFGIWRPTLPGDISGFTGTLELGGSGSHRTPGSVPVYPCNVEISGTGIKTWFQSTTITGDLTINGATLIIETGDALQVTDLTLTGTAPFLDTQGQEVMISRLLTNNSTHSSVFDAASTVLFNGNDDPVISGSSSTTFNHLTISKSGGANLSVNQNITVNGTLRWESSHNIVLISPSVLTMASGSLVTGYASIRMVDGPMKKIGNTAFIFPIGDGTRYGQLCIRNLTGDNTTEFTAQYFAEAHGNIARVDIKDPDANGLLNNMSGEEYWTLDRSVTTSSADVDLYWDDASESGIDDEDDLRIAHFNTSSKWENYGASFISYGSPSGYIRVAGVSSFSPFTFGSEHGVKNPLNNAPLPIELLFLNATSNFENIELNWATASELNNDHFELEKSTDGHGFQKIGTVKGNGTTNETLYYKFTDSSPFSGINYYRLKQVDYDGTFEYSKVVSVEQYLDLENAFELFPNPASKDNVTVRVLDPDLGNFQLQLYDTYGRLYYQGQFETNKAGNISIRPTVPLQEGVYFVNLIHNGQTRRQKLVVND